MDGSRPPRSHPCPADRDALLMVDDCHATGFIGPKGRGTPAHFGVTADIVTGTLGKAMGGAIGGFIAASDRIVSLLRQRARPYLFSNALPPMVCAAGIEAIRLIEDGDGLRERCEHCLLAGAAHRCWFRSFRVAIVPVMLGNKRLAQDIRSTRQA